MYHFCVSHLYKIDIKLPAEKLDGFLQHPLLNYAHVLAEVLMESFGGYPFYGMKKSGINNELKDIDKGYKELMYRAQDQIIKYPIFKGYEDLKTEKERKEFVIEKSKIKPRLEFLTRRKEELKRYKKILSSEKSSRKPIGKKFKISSIWALMLRRRERIVWPDVIRFYSKKSSTWEIRVRSSLWQEFVSSADWPNIVRLLDWFHNKLKDTTYGAELELKHEIKEGRVKYLQRHCSSIIEKDVKDAISNFRVFIPEGLPVEIRFIPYSIKFNKKSIEISGIKEKNVFTKKVDFIKDKDKKYFSFDHSISEQLSSITFPNGEIFKAPTTREMLISTLACLSGLKFL